jgi:hypothetical protein
MKYRVLKVKTEKYGIKYIPQEKCEEFMFIYNWKNFYEIKNGTDEMITCFYDTIEEAWDRIDKHEENTIINNQSYDTLGEFYE